MALLFPNSYRVAMANLGFQIVHSMLSETVDGVCERFFAPADGGLPLSFESNRPLTEFPLIFCSVSFEEDYPTLVRMLYQGGISLRTAQRHSGGIESPLVICGGVATFINPEPIAPFVDLFLVGEAEPVLRELVQLLIESIGRLHGEELLAIVARKWRCCYVPSHYKIEYLDDGRVGTIAPLDGTMAKPRRIVHCGDSKAGHSFIVTPAAEFADIFLAELGRGCSRACRFCAASFVYRPPRNWSSDAILAALAERPANVNRIGLLGMEMIKSDDLARVGAYLLEQGCALSFSSFRADVLGGLLQDILAKSHLKSAAIAPDGCSERLRRVINKGLSTQDIVQGAEILAATGIANIKLYLMVGLPTESEEDWEEACALIGNVRERLLRVGRKLGRMPSLILSINSFVPKPWTPFQFHPFADVDFLRKAFRYFRKVLAPLGNVTIIAQQPEKTLFQALLARGDRRIADGLERMVEPGNWRHAFKRSQIDTDFYTKRQRDRMETFPWEVLDHGLDKEYLWQEYQKALQGKSTPPCNPETCCRCGICNHKREGPC